MVKKDLPVITEADKNTSTKDLTRIVLIAIGAGLLVSTLTVMPGLVYALKPLIKDKSFHPSSIIKTLNRLKFQGLVTVEKVGDQTAVNLTEKGQKKLSIFKLKDIQINRIKWDGWWRLVIFDIPEKKKPARDLLRFKLKELDFYMLQKSVLVTPWECRGVVDLIKSIYDIGNCVNLIMARHFDDEDLVKNYFELE